MKKTALALTLLSGLIYMVPSDANAQYSGPSATSTTTVSDVLNNAKDDDYVRLKGNIIEQMDKEEFMFADDSGEIRTEIEKDQFSEPVDENTTVEIRGEVEKDFMESPEIEVDSLIIKGEQDQDNSDAAQ